MNRVTTITVGAGLVIVGIPMLALPGPGILAIAGGLTLLGQEFDWARDSLDWAKTRLERFAGKDDESG